MSYAVEWIRGVVVFAHATAFAHDEPDEAGAILEDATRDAA